jgi:hypothetical protein
VRPAPAPEKVDLSQEQLEKTATHVVIGTVRNIYHRKQQKGPWDTTHFLAEVQVHEVEKGGGISKDQPLYARYWSRRFTGRTAPPSTNGHRGLPQTGARVRIYLARNAYDGFTRDNLDGGFNVIGANGFGKLDP